MRSARPPSEARAQRGAGAFQLKRFEGFPRWDRRMAALALATRIATVLLSASSQTGPLSAQESVQDSLPTVVVLSTGGAIASTHSEEEGGFTSNLPGEQLVAAVPGLDQVAIIEVQNVANVGSTNMTPALWLEVSRRAIAALERDEVAGVLVTHGTPEFGALGFVDADGVRFYRAPLRHQSIPMSPDVVLPTVDIIPNYAGSDGRLIRGLLKEGPVDASGAGTIAGALFEAVKEAREQGVALPPTP